MSFPFGGHPKFGHFKVWAKSQGIQCENASVEINGQAVKVTLFILEDGTKVPVTDILDGEFLTPSQVSRLERRLGVLSPFPASPSAN